MASQAWTIGPICGTDNCQSRHYRMSDGLTICRFGHVMDGEFEFNDEEDQPIVAQTRRIAGVQIDARGVLTKAAPLASQHSNHHKKLYGQAAKDCYFKCLQILLKKLTLSIIHSYFPESIRVDLTTLVKTNWIKLLSAYFKDSKKGIATIDLISIIYISIVQLRYHPLYIHELLEGLKTGEIPYIKCLHLIPKTLLDILPSSYHNQLQPHRLPVNNILYNHISNNLLRMGTPLEVPINYYYTFIMKILSETLILPQSLDLFSMLVKLTQYLDISTLELTNQKFPELQLLGIIIFITKLSFSLIKTDNTFRSKIDINVWLQNLEAYELNNECTSYHNLDYNQLLDWSDDKVDKYCDWINDNMLPASHRHDSDQEGLPVTSKRLFQIFSREDEPKTKRVKVDSRQNDDPVELPISVVLQQMCKPTVSSDSTPPPNPATLTDLESKLYSKLSSLFGTTKEVMLRGYSDFEKQLQIKVQTSLR